MAFMGHRRSLSMAATVYRQVIWSPQRRFQKEATSRVTFNAEFMWKHVWRRTYDLVWSLLCFWGTTGKKCWILNGVWDNEAQSAEGPQGFRARSGFSGVKLESHDTDRVLVHTNSATLYTSTWTGSDLRTQTSDQTSGSSWRHRHKKGPALVINPLIGWTKSTNGWCLQIKCCNAK